MEIMSQIIEGTVGTLNHFKDGMKDGKPTGYANYDLVLTDGTTHKLNIRKSDAPEKGQFVRLEPARFGQVTLARREEGSAAPASNGSSNGSSVNGASYTPKSGNDRDGYWEKRFTYETTEMYPKIEFQAISAMAVSIYAAGMPYLETPPTTTEELDYYFQSALDKGRSVFEAINKK